MLAFIENLNGGNAIRLVVIPETDTSRWVILRKTTASFSGYDDPNAVCIVDANLIERTTHYDYLDIDHINSGTTYYYACYEYDTEWTAINIKSIVSQDPVLLISGDPFDVLIERIDSGFQSQQTRNGFEVAVRTVPPNLDHDPLPVVSVRVLSNKIIDWALASELIPDEYMDPDWQESRGWFGQLTVDIRSFALSSQVRNTLRKSLQSIIQANLSVFPAYGWFGINFDQRDSEDYKSNNTPVFVSIAELSFTYASTITRMVDEIADIEIEYDTDPLILSLQTS